MSNDKNSPKKNEEQKVTVMANLKHLAEEKERREGKTPKRVSQSTRDILKCIIVLTMIGVIAGVILGAVNFVTYVDADAAIMSEIGARYSLESENVKKDDARAIAPDGAKSFIKASFAVFEDANDEGSLKAVVYHAVGSGAYSGTVELLVFVENDIVKEITVYSHSETNGIGTKVFEDSHLAKYKGINIKGMKSFVRSSDETVEGNVMFVSGATKTSTGVHNALNAVVYAYNNYGGDAL